MQRGLIERMAYDYIKAFALTDNPFSPIQSLGLKSFGAQSDLQTRPLLLHAEPGLDFLFSPDAGPFGEYLTKFQKHARLQGYRDNPPSVGVSSHLFSIFGFEGTGKTTLAQKMASWLMTCRPKVGGWYVRDEWSFAVLKDPVQQIAFIDAEQESLSKDASDNSYCCVVVDNLLPGAFDRALLMFDELRKTRAVFMFLLSNHRELFPRLGGAGDVRYPITAYRTWPLSANGAISFVKHRIGKFRVPDAERPAWLVNQPLFPFNEQDIQSAFATGSININLGDTVALRDFSVMVDRMLRTKLESLPDDFELSPLDEATAVHHHISLAAGYNRLVAA